MKDQTILAAIDMGSNSFRMELGRIEHGQLLRTEYLKETVRLGNGLDKERQLGAEATQRGLACLSRFAERIRHFQPAQVRAVATQTLREAHNRDEFIQQAQAILGFPIEVISGREEARLIFAGVSRLLPQVEERRLVVDIGGRSTEIIIGSGYSPTQADSFRVGSVSSSMKFFANGEFTLQRFEHAKVAAMAMMEEALSYVTPTSWDTAYGSSGTVGAVLDVLEAEGHAAHVVTLEQLLWLRDRLIKAGHIDRVRLAGMKEDRKAVIGGGLSILLAFFELFDVQELHGAKGALRHGVLWDLISRETEESDVRMQTVQRLQQRFTADPAQALRVRTLALDFYAHLQGEASEASLSAKSKLAQVEALRDIRWAADLHEIGMVISHSDYHRHGAYLLEHADAAGFSDTELQRLGHLVLAQRGRLRKVEHLLQADPLFAQQVLALRLAIVLCHARRTLAIKGLRLTKDRSGFTLEVDAQWVEQHPQSMVLLHEEVDAWRKTPYVLRMKLL